MNSIVRRPFELADPSYPGVVVGQPRGQGLRVETAVPTATRVYPRNALPLAPLASPVESLYRKYLRALHVEGSSFGGAKALSADEVDLLCRCITHCNNLREVIETAERFTAALGPRTGQLSLVVGKTDATFSLDTFRARGTRAGRLGDVFGLCFYYKLFSCLIGMPLRATSIRFTHKAFTDRKALELLFDHPIEFNASNNALAFNKQALERPLVTSHADLARLTATGPLELTPLPQEPSLANYLEQFVRQILDKEQGIPTVDRLAPLIGKSGPTLRRRLAEEGTSFQIIIDKCRLERACTLLAQPDLTIDEIAVRLGFSAPSGFSRAFKDWTGSAPSQYRQRPRAVRGNAHASAQA